jgi:hypothetical protein
MTVGLMIILGSTLAGLVAAMSNWLQLRALPTRTDQAYDESVPGRALGHKIVIAAGLVLPFIAYGVVSLVPADELAIKVF